MGSSLGRYSQGTQHGIKKMKEEELEACIEKLIGAR